MKKLIITVFAFVMLGCLIACERNDGTEDSRTLEAVTSVDSTEYAKTDDPDLTDKPSSGEQESSDSESIKWTGVH